MKEASADDNPASSLVTSHPIDTGEAGDGDSTMTDGNAEDASTAEQTPVPLSGQTPDANPPVDRLQHAEASATPSANTASTPAPVDNPSPPSVAIPTEPSAACTTADEGPAITFTVTFGKNSSSVTKPNTFTVGALKALIAQTTGVPVSNQKLLQKGVPLKDDGKTLEQAGVKDKAKLMLIGSAPAALPNSAATNSSSSTSTGVDSSWDAPAEPITKQEVHAKVLAKGRPEDGWPGIAGRQVPLGDDVNMIPGLLNSQGTKVRLTFKPDLQQLWIGSAVSTHKVPYATIAKIEATPLDTSPEYSILALHLGTTSNSILRLYYFPSQHVASMKIRILGVGSLI